MTAVIGLSSCDLISGLFDPDYVGTWVIEEILLFDKIDYETKTTMILKKDTWEMRGEGKDENDDWKLSMNEKGTLVVDGDKLTIITDGDGDENKIVYTAVDSFLGL